MIEDFQSAIPILIIAFFCVVAFIFYIGMQAVLPLFTFAYAVGMIFAYLLTKIK